MKDIERRVHDNEINISKLAKSIRGNIESIENLDKQIQTIAESAENIASLESAVANNAAAIEELKAGGTGAADTTALEQQIAQNATNIAENTNQIAIMRENYRIMANALNRITELEKLHGLAEEVWGTRGTSVEEITALLDDYATESNFCTETTTHLQFGTFGETGPSAKIFFRQNPLRTTSPSVVLKFDFSNLPSGISALPCTITLNGIELFSGSLAVDLTAEFQAVATLPIDPSAHNIVMFNEINVQFNDTRLASTILDFVEVEITNSQNCIVLNRANHVNIYGWVNGVSKWRRLICSRYYKGVGFKSFQINDQTSFESAEPNAAAFPASTVGGHPVVFAYRYLQENWNTSNNGKFTYTLNYQLDYYINTQNQLYVNYNQRAPSTLTATFYHVDNVLYAKKSLHNGLNYNIEDAVVVHTDFSIGRYYAHYYGGTSSNFLTKQSFQLSTQEYPSEFVDFVPVDDHTLGSTRTTTFNVGYFLLHKSGNILFVPHPKATYFIKIGKGRQVTASYHTDFMGIDVFYQYNGKVYKKILERTETNSTEWTLSETVETIEDADCVFDNDVYHFKINKGEVTAILKE